MRPQSGTATRAAEKWFRTEGLAASAEDERQEQGNRQIDCSSGDTVNRVDDRSSMVG